MPIRLAPLLTLAAGAVLWHPQDSQRAAAADAARLVAEIESADPVAWERVRAALAARADGLELLARVLRDVGPKRLAEPPGFAFVMFDSPLDERFRESVPACEQLLPANRLAGAPTARGDPGTALRAGQAAVDALARMGAPGLPLLLDALERPPLGAHAENALVQVGAAARDPLRAALPALNVTGRIHALRALAHIGGDPVPLLEPALSAFTEWHHSPELQRAGALALTIVGAPAVPPLIALLGDQDKVQRRLAAGGLALLAGPVPSSVRGAAPALVARVQGTDLPVTRVWVIAALARAFRAPDPAEPETRPAPGAPLTVVVALTKALADEQPGVRVAALMALAAIGGTAREPLAQTVPAWLRHADPLLRMGALRAIAQSEQQAREWLPLTVAALDDATLEVQREATAALGAFGAAALPQLTAQLDSREYGIQAAAAEAIARAGLAGVPALIELTRDEAAPHWHAGIEGLRRVAARSPAALARLAELLASPEAPVRAAATDACALLAGSAERLLPAVEKSLDDPEDRVRVAAARALLPVAGDATAAVLKALRQRLPAEGTDEVLVAIAESLGRMGSFAAPAVDDLAAMAARSEGKAREAGRQALQAILCAQRATSRPAR